VVNDAPEAALVILARLGDQDAFGSLVRRRQGSVRGLLRRLSADPALGDDLAQETFVRAWQGLGRLREPSAFGGWLRQIAVSVWLQHARRRRVVLDPISESDDISISPADPAERLDVDAALGRLSGAERLCLVLAHVEGMSHSEIAESTGLPLGTVKSHINRGAARLRRWLQPHIVEPAT
jgi:RNA polymerase sigma-70 factor (ECF subfamily)